MISIWQIILITLVVWVVCYETNNAQVVVKCFGQKTLLGFLTGLIMGNVQLGLLVGGTFELMALGLAGFGGASIPNYAIATVIGTAMAIVTNGGLEIALVVGVPAATLGTTFDVFAKMIGTQWLHIAQSKAEKGDYKGCYRVILFCNVFLGRVALNNVYPVIIFLCLGSAFIESFVAVIPAVLIKCLTTAGNLLPALGMAILLKYLPIKGNFHYLLLGFVLTVYLKLDILPIALIGGIIAVVVFKAREKEAKTVMVSAQGGIGDE